MRYEAVCYRPKILSFLLLKVLMFFLFSLNNICPLQLKSERELDKLKGLKLVELSLEKNPLCDHFKDQADYIRSVLILSCVLRSCEKGCVCVG